MAANNLQMPSGVSDAINALFGAKEHMETVRSAPISSYGHFEEMADAYGKASRDVSEAEIAVITAIYAAKVWEWSPEGGK